MKKIIREIGLCFKAGFLSKPSVLKDTFSVRSDSMLKKLKIIDYCTFPFIVLFASELSLSFGKYIRDFLLEHNIISNEFVIKVFPLVIFVIIAIPCINFIFSILYVIALLIFKLLSAFINSRKKHKQ